MKADTILQNGFVQTMTGETCSAVVYKDGVILYVGSDEGAASFISEGTKVIDLKGKMVVPGFIDGHTHEVSNIIDENNLIFFDRTETTIEAYQKLLQDFIKSHPNAEFYAGSGLDLSIYGEEPPNNRWVNEICNDKIVFISDVSMHGRLINDAAIDYIGLSKDTKPPEGCTIYRYADGELTGYFSDGTEYFDKLPKFEHTKEDFKKSFLEFQKTANSYGITGIDIAGCTIDAPDAWEVFHEMENEGTLTLRVNCTHCIMPLDFSEKGGQETVDALNMGQKFNSNFQRISQAKTMIDGVPEGHTAYLAEPYAPEAGEEKDYRGVVYASAKGLNEYVATIDKAGYQVQIHAMGDAGVSMALDAFENARKLNGKRDSRHMIAHITLISDDDIKRMGALGVIGNMQPLWWYNDPNFSPLEEKALGTERFKREYKIRTMMDAGIAITGSIDYPIQDDYRPLAGIQVGVTQSSPYAGERDDPKFTKNPDQTVTPLQMLECYTINGAFEMMMEDLVGSIEVGKKADLVVLDQNILTCDPTQIVDTKICYTISDGRIVYER